MAPMYVSNDGRPLWTADKSSLHRESRLASTTARLPLSTLLSDGQKLANKSVFSLTT